MRKNCTVGPALRNLYPVLGAPLCFFSLLEFEVLYEVAIKYCMYLVFSPFATGQSIPPGLFYKMESPFMSVWVLSHQPGR